MMSFQLKDHKSNIVTFQNFIQTGIGYELTLLLIYNDNFVTKVYINSNLNLFADVKNKIKQFDNILFFNYL